MDALPIDLLLDRKNKVPIYLQILSQIRDLILSGRLEAGALLPPERLLARQLGLNRSTILNAYRELKNEGLVEACVGRGTTVLPRPGQETDDGRAPALSWRHHFRGDSARGHAPLLRDLLALRKREDVIPLSIGLPAPDLLPVELFAEIQSELSRELGSTMLLHSPTEGITPLRKSLCAWSAARGIGCTPDEILLLSGSQQGLDLVSRVFLEPGDTVMVEEPTFFGALQTFSSHRARLIAIPCDDQGIRCDVLAELLERQRPKFIYTLPTFQNPSGSVMSLARRKELLRLAYRFQVPIIEDDPYSDLRYDGDTLPSLKALDERGLVLYLSTMSKVLFPGLRIGWLTAPREVIRRFVLVKQSMDLHSNTPGQWIIDAFLRRGHYDRHLAKLREAYSERRDIMDATLKRDTPAGFTWTKPEGGLYYWCRLPRNVNPAQLLTEAAAAGVSFLPGWSCFVDDPGPTHIRLNFSYPERDLIATGVERLFEALRKSGLRPHGQAHDAVATPPIV